MKSESSPCNQTQPCIDNNNPIQSSEDQVEKECQVEPENRFKHLIKNRILSMGHKGHYQRVLQKNNNVVTQDSRSQSLPDCLLEENNKSNDEQLDESNLKTDQINGNNGESSHLLLTLPETSQTAITEQWFKTWPERCDKIKSNNDNNDGESNPNYTQAATLSNNCDTVDGEIVIKNKFTLSEALQNISLAYSPLTKQLHLVEQCKVPPIEEKPEEHGNENKFKPNGHRRNEAGSFSSTISTLSDPSTSGSLLDGDEKSLSSLNAASEGPSRRKSLTNFFSKNVFGWKSSGNTSESNSVWKLFSKSKTTTSTSPLHAVASSSALIQLSRPSNLPAKTQEEEERHREEYKAIVAAAKKKEAYNTAIKQKLHKVQLQQEEQQAIAAKHFTKHVLPQWDLMKSNKKTRDLWWQGLPSCIRGKVWRLAIGNELNLTQQLYEICLNRAQNRLNSPEPSNCESDFDQESSMEVIQLDISRTFPNLCIFQKGGPYSDILHSLLAAYVCYRPDVGYVQGMSYIAAILILNMDACDAFICFANLLNQPLHLSAFTLNQEQMEAYYMAYKEVFNYNLPKLYKHFETSNLTPDLYLLDWIYTIYAKSMPLDVACRVWDIFLRDGYEFLFRTALGILHLNQDTLIDMDFLHGAQFLTRLPDDLSSDQLFKSIQAVSTSIGKMTFCQIVEKYNSGTFR